MTELEVQELMSLLLDLNGAMGFLGGLFGAACYELFKHAQLWLEKRAGA